MCGLWGGLSTTLVAQEVEVVKTLGIVSQLRGLDSTGVITGKRGAKNKLNFVLQKAVVSSGEFLSEHDVNKEMSGSFVIVGHCRSATVGSVTVTNAQPFRSEHILGCHNGTIKALEPTRKNDDRSDSAVFFDLLAKEGLQSAIDKARWGAYALVWINQQSGCINFLRNSQRPLWVSSNNSGTTVFWASEKEILEFALKRAGINHFPEPVQLPEDTHWIVDLHASTFFGDTEIVRPSPLPPPPPTNHTVHRSQRNHDKRSSSALTPFSDSDWEKALKEADEAEAAAKKASQKEEGHESFAWFRSFRNIDFGIRYAIKYLTSGCVCCGTNPGLTGESWWFTKTDFLCDKCVSHRFAKFYLKDCPIFPGKIVGDLGKELSKHSSLPPTGTTTTTATMES